MKKIMQDRVIYARKKRTSLTQKGFGELIGMSQRSISSYETGEAQPSRRALRRIADCTGISFHWLLTGEGSPDLPQEAETAADAGDGSDQGRNALKHGSGDSGIDKRNRVNVNLANSKTQLSEEAVRDILIKTQERQIQLLEEKVADLQRRLDRYEQKREAHEGK